MLAPKRSWIQQVVYLIGMYGQFLKVYVKTLVEYRADTLIAVIAGIVAQGSTLIFLTVIFNRIPTLAGWDFYELVFMFGLAATGRALNQTFFNAPFLLTGYIRNGRMDMMMVRPVGVLFQAIGYSQELNGVGQLITGFAIMGYSASHLDMAWTFLSVLYVGIALLCSAFIQFSILLTISVLTFWIQEVRSLIYPITWLYDFTRYPLQIFHPLLRGLLTYIIPYSLASFYPAAYLLRPEQYGWAVWGVPAAAMVIVMMAYFIWSQGLKRYSSVAG
ncbi:ABC-2 family transporter protein [Paenibacillus qinlingensis]|uniref:ABC-2 type transport system permease protein n=1 Tax=Paenibacillus qinlingensis TaxID=1837343 RepID=A0ABU1NVI6_9BACL|nr:ABC-2 family transporter protein [Paenibacillus qinlingensis]MDR6551106.1 ABC-2 type transport system permease protein [Paenibacillus qinlingensis]